MNQTVTVLLPVWLAVACWFVGTASRFVPKPSLQRLGAWVWLSGSLLMGIHIVGSYAFVYEWSHAAAIRATAEESQRVTGIDAGWGVYVNFLFAAVWLLQAVLRVRAQVIPTWIDRTLLAFTATIVAMATLVFESGPVRILSGIGFCLLFVLAIRTAIKSRTRR